MEKRHAREAITLGFTVLGLVGISFLAFSVDQRKWIKERDGNKCQFPDDHECNEKIKLEVHHVKPQGYLKRQEINPDYAENGISLCEESHQWYIHNPEVQSNENEIYWDTTWDQKMEEQARTNTINFQAQGHVFP